jgi:hypothetical protein
MPFGVPDDPAGRHLLKPERGRILVKVPDCDGARDREATRQPIPEVGAVEVCLGAPRDEGGGLGAQVFG